MKKIGFLLICGWIATAGAAETSPKDMNFTGPVTDPVWVCMMKRTVQPRTSYTYDYQGKTYHFCCTHCLSKFQTDPEHFKLATDPVNGKMVDKASAPIYSYHGRAYFFSSPRNVKKFAKKPEKYLVHYTEKPAE